MTNIHLPVSEKSKTANLPSSVYKMKPEGLKRQAVKIFGFTYLEIAQIRIIQYGRQK